MHSKSGAYVVQYYTEMEITEKWLNNNLTAEEESELRDSCKSIGIGTPRSCLCTNGTMASSSTSIVPTVTVVQIFIKTLVGKTIALDVGHLETIDDIKIKIHVFFILESYSKMDILWMTTALEMNRLFTYLEFYLVREVCFASCGTSSMYIMAGQSQQMQLGRRWRASQRL